jgi:hypothetical protein
VNKGTACVCNCNGSGSMCFANVIAYDKVFNSVFIRGNKGTVCVCVIATALVACVSQMLLRVTKCSYCVYLREQGYSVIATAL